MVTNIIFLIILLNTVYSFAYSQLVPNIVYDTNISINAQ